MAEFVDPYLDAKTGVLKNKLDAKTSKKLREAEGDIISAAEIKIDEIPHTRDLAELRQIHKLLFSKIYDWAGELRIVDIRKDSEEYFLSQNYLENGAKFVFDELVEENYLCGLNREDFAKRLAYFYEQLNFIHPFREGNGRTQRLFWQRIANDAGYEIAWEEVVGDILDQASMTGRVEHDLEPLERMFDKIVKKP